MNWENMFSTVTQLCSVVVCPQDGDSQLVDRSFLTNLTYLKHSMPREMWIFWLSLYMIFQKPILNHTNLPNYLDISTRIGRYVYPLGLFGKVSDY